MTTTVQRAALFLGQGMAWELRDGVSNEALGFLPAFWSVYDERSAREQADANYEFGTGWELFKDSHKLEGSREDGYELLYRPANPDPEDGLDPPLREMARAEMRDELIVLFEAEFVAIIQKDGSFVTQRMD